MKISKILVLSIIPVVLTACASTFAQDKKETDTATATSASPTRQANIDPVTGELSSQAPAGSASGTRSAGVKRAPIEYTTHPDGTVEGDLNGWYQSNLNVTLGCDGELDTEHSEEQAEAHTRCVESE